MPDRPWEALPDAVGPVLRAELDALADEIIAAIAEGVPDYAQPLEGDFGRGCASACRRRCASSSR